MNNLRIILFFVIATGFVVGIFVLQYILSLHSVKFVVAKDVSVQIYKVVDNAKEAPFKTLDSSVTLSLQNGDYCLKPDDSNYNPEPICFTVENKDLSVTVDPSYSKDFLASILDSEQDIINELIVNKYSPLINNFNLRKGSLFGRGEWYGTTLTQKVARSSQGDVYRIILKKVNEKWTIVAYPQIVLNKYDYPQVPYDILDKVNRLVGTQGESLPSTPSNSGPVVESGQEWF